MSRVLYDERWIGNHGIGRFASEVRKRLDGLTAYNRTRRPWHPLDPFLLAADLMVSETDLFFSPGYNSPRGWNGRFIFTLHDLNHICVADNSNALKRAYYRHIIRPACRKACFVLTVSEYSRSEIAEWAGISGDKIINVSNGVARPFEPFGSRYNPGYPYLLYVGSRKPHKNLSRLIRGYSLSGVARDLRLVLSGEPDREIRAKIESYGVKDRVAFAPLDSSEALAEAYRGATGLLFPSLYEGFGLPPLEAMACGTPVLTSNLCSLPEVVGDAAVLVNPLLVEDIADGIRRLVGDSELQRQLREKGRQRARRFSWDETVRRIHNAIQLAVGERETEGKVQLQGTNEQQRRNKVA